MLFTTLPTYLLYLSDPASLLGSLSVGFDNYSHLIAHNFLVFGVLFSQISSNIHTSPKQKKNHFEGDRFLFGGRGLCLATAHQHCLTLCPWRSSRVTWNSRKQLHSEQGGCRRWGRQEKGWGTGRKHSCSFTQQSGLKRAVPTAKRKVTRNLRTGNFIITKDTAKLLSHGSFQHRLHSLMCTILVCCASLVSD